MYNAFKKVKFTRVAENGRATSVDFSASRVYGNGGKLFLQEYSKNGGEWSISHRSSAKLPRNSGLIENLR